MESQSKTFVRRSIFVFDGKRVAVTIQGLFQRPLFFESISKVTVRLNELGIYR